ncbi:MAG TPA: PhoH family protein [Sediminispirochaeta sp.]|nr:PhoH family protein [Sediminispirochaeta sp.]
MQSERKIKTFVIDTNVFIHKYDAILSFKDNEVVVPLWVLEELDNLKTYSDERGRNARHAIRFLDGLAKQGDIHKGVKMENGSILKVLLDYDHDLKVDLLTDKPDNKILLTALTLQKRGRKVFFVSKDINARVKATAIGLKAVDYEKQKVNISELYQGFRTGDISVDSYRELEEGRSIPWNNELHPNEFVILRDKEHPEPQLGRYDTETKELRPVPPLPDGVSGIRPLNIHQRMAFDLLLDESVSLVTLMGKAGTGKTLLAIAAGLKKVVDDGAYHRVLVSRPVMPLGKDIGFLPGAKEEKLSHWMQPLFDNMEYILSVHKRPNLKSIEAIVNSNMVEIEAITYIRGRSLPNQYIIIDEAQNLSPHEIKTIVSRAGEKTKVVLTGDPYQIDSPYLDSNSNGLSYLVEAFKGQSIFGQVVLEHSERSLLAELAAELL